MAHLLDHPLHLSKYFGPKDRGIPNAGIDCRVNLIGRVVHQPQTSSHELLLEEGHLRPLHFLLPHHLSSLYHVLKVQVQKALLMGVLALSPGVDSIATRIRLEGICKRISVWVTKRPNAMSSLSRLWVCFWWFQMVMSLRVLLWLIGARR